MATGPTASCAASAPRAAVPASGSQRPSMTIDFAPNPAYPRPQQWPPTFGGPFLFQNLTRFRENRDEAHLSTEPPREQPPSRLPSPQADRPPAPSPGPPPFAGPDEAVDLIADPSPPPQTESATSRA